MTPLTPTDIEHIADVIADTFPLCASQLREHAGTMRSVSEVTEHRMAEQRCVECGGTNPNLCGRWFMPGNCPVDFARPRVVHLKRESYDVRIDRQTHWGNPFAIGKDGTREQVIEKHRDWVLAAENMHMVTLAVKELRGKVLGCWCAPKACHGDTLIRIANANLGICVTHSWGAPPGQDNLPCPFCTGYFRSR